ncbi:MAG: thiol:disulfide interchange protein, partial [Dysgonamonadaceae bacterium]|nr:thiol:disulfide interchange protein [Dysgonamonadaceae bacterium]
MTKYINFILIFLFYCYNISAQIQEPVKWRYHINESGEIIFQAVVEKGWHLYDMNLPEGGPISTSFEFEKMSGAELAGKVHTDSKIHSQYEEMFGMTVRWFSENPTFVQKLKITDKAKFQIIGRINYMSCNDENCIPGEEEFQFTTKDLPAGSGATPAIDSPPPADSGPILSVLSPLNASSDTTTIDYWTPVITELQNFGQDTSTTDKSWLLIFILGFGGGLLALLTPCVWPIIPMTVSFFLKRSKSNRKKAISDAITYGLAIIVIYLLLGLLITAIFGASALNDLSTNAVFNL